VIDPVADAASSATKPHLAIPSINESAVVPVACVAEEARGDGLERSAEADADDTTLVNGSSRATCGAANGRIT
jgi:hypothetical protein